MLCLDVTVCSLVPAFLPGSIAALIEIPFSRMLQEGFYYIHIFRVIWAYAGMLFVGLIGALFNIGITHMHMESARDIRPQFQIFCIHFETDRTSLSAVSLSLS